MDTRFSGELLTLISKVRESLHYEGASQEERELDELLLRVAIKVRKKTGLFLAA